jgi:putative DNA primase/helicase
VPDTAPWPEPADGAAVIVALLALVLRYIVMPKSAAVALVLWVLHTYAMDAWENSPILAVLSPTKQCGKTTVITLSEALVYRAFACANVTPAVLFRLIEAERPTLLLDEADTWLLDEHSELRGIVNSGHTKTAAVAPRCVGDNHDVSAFSTWAAKMIAMIGKPPETILDRSIVVSMNRKAKTETVMRLRSRTFSRQALPSRQQLRRWADDHRADLTDADPAMPDALNDRQADSWRPLLVLADALGGNWPALARQAALDLSGQGNDA